MFCGRIRRQRYSSFELPEMIRKPDREEEVAMDVSRGLNRLRKEGTFCDITLRVGEKTIRAHKVVIALRSPYFMAMFSGHFSESNQQDISIKELDADSLELLIDYMYTGRLAITSDNVKKLILTASFLQVTKAEWLCCYFIRGELNEKNCIEYMLLGASTSIKRLVDLSVETAAYKLAFVLSRNEYLELEQEEFKQLVQRSKEIRWPEDLLYSFVMRWINSSHDTRIDFLDELLELLDPSLVSPHVIHESKLLNASSPIIAAWAARACATSTSNEPAGYILVSQRLDPFCLVRIKIYSQAKHRQINPLPKTITDGSYVCNGYYIYHQGGSIRGEPVTDSYVYHPIRCGWVSFIRLQEARAYHRSCVLKGKIFSVGGSDGFKAFSSVEFTDLHTGQRGFVDSLPRAKKETGIGIHENSIYVVGGSERGKGYKCIHRFDGREGVWQELAPSPYRAGASSCAVIGESIYTTHPDTLQRYDIPANDWAMISAEFKRYPPEVFAIDNTLFGLFTDHVARFIPEGGKWENLQTLKCNRPYLQVSTNLLFPNVNEEDIEEPEFDGFKAD